MTRPFKCPKRDFKSCLGEACGWWVPLRGAEGEATGRCSVLHIAISLDSTAAAMWIGSDDDGDVLEQEEKEVH